MLNFFRRKLLLNYIFPPYQPIESNGLATDMEFDANINEHNSTETINLDEHFDIGNKSLPMLKASKK